LVADASGIRHFRLLSNAGQLRLRRADRHPDTLGRRRHVDVVDLVFAPQRIRRSITIWHTKRWASRGCG
jgi:hypothetical protein